MKIKKIVWVERYKESWRGAVWFESAASPSIGPHVWLYYYPVDSTWAADFYREGMIVASKYYHGTKAEAQESSYNDMAKLLKKEGNCAKGTRKTATHVSHFPW